MGDQRKIEIAPTLLEVPSSGLDSYSSSEFVSLFTDEPVGTLVAKVGALEGLWSLVTRDCEFNDFIREILTLMMNVVKSEAGSILEADQMNRSLFFRSVVGSRSDKVINFIVPFGQGIAGYVAESKSSLLVDNVPENKVHLKSIEKAVGFETKNLVAIPIIIRTRVYGVLELLNRIGEENYSSADLELLTYLCRMAAKAIEVRLMINWAKSKNQPDKKDDHL